MDRGDAKLADTVNQLEKEEKEDLLKYTAHWNTNSKNCYPAQVGSVFHLRLSLSFMETLPVWMRLLGNS